MRNLLEQMRQIGSRKGREKFGRFRIEGIRLVERALRAGVSLDSVIVGETFAACDAGREHALLAEIKQGDMPFNVVDDADIRDLLGGRKLGDIVAAVPFLNTDSLRELSTPASANLFMGIVNVVEPGNVGAIIRTAHGLGAAAVLTCGVSDPYHPKAARTAMGSLFRIPVLQFATAHAMLNALHENNIKTAATVSQGGILLPDFQTKGEKFAVLLGNEFMGLSAEISNQATHRITIPMLDTIDSFSVSAAAAIVLYALKH